MLDNWESCIAKKFSQFLENSSESAENFPFEQPTFLECFHFGEKCRNLKLTVLKIMHFTTSLVKHQLFWLKFLISGHWFSSSSAQDISRQLAMYELWSVSKRRSTLCSFGTPTFYYAVNIFSFVVKKTIWLFPLDTEITGPLYSLTHQFPGESSIISVETSSNCNKERNARENGVTTFLCMALWLTFHALSHCVLASSHVTCDKLVRRWYLANSEVMAWATVPLVSSNTKLGTT